MEKRYTLRYIALAQSDLIEIVNYISEQLNAPDAAMNLVDKFEKATSVLEQFPFSGQPYRSNGKLKDEYRTIAVENYLIFYVVLDSIVEIRRVIYNKRDFKKLLT